jgi:ribose transport system permease protein
MAASPAWRFFVLMVVALAALIGPLRDTGFFSFAEVENVVRDQSTIVIMAVVAVFVIASGEIDLSFAAVVPVAAYVAALVMRNGGNAGLGIAAALAVGMCVGLVNGFVVVIWHLPSFIVSLGTMSILEGLALWVTDSQPVSVTDETFVAIFGNSSVGIIPMPFIWVMATMGVGYFVLNWTPVGKKILATGANREVARACGINTSRIQVGVMVASALGGALAGLVYAGLLGSAQYTLGSTDLLTVLAAAIIGGTSLAGGKGSAIGGAIAALMLGALQGALILLGLGVPQQSVFEGAVVVLAIVLGSGRQLPIRQWLHRLGAPVPPRRDPRPAPGTGDRTGDEVSVHVPEGKK